VTRLILAAVLAALRTLARFTALALVTAADAVATFTWSVLASISRPGGLAAVVTSARYRAAWRLAEAADRKAEGQVTSLSVRPGPVLRVLGAPNPLEGGTGHAR
jgi:hypothetical protein